MRPNPIPRSLSILFLVVAAGACQTGASAGGTVPFDSTHPWVWQSLQLPTMVRYSPACSMVGAATAGPVAAGIASALEAAGEAPPPAIVQAASSANGSVVKGIRSRMANIVPPAPAGR